MMGATITTSATAALRQAQWRQVLCPVAAAGLAVNVCFFAQMGPLQTASTAVPIWLTTLLLSALLSGGGGPRYAAALLSALLSALLLVAGSHEAWPWSLLLGAVYLTNPSSSSPSFSPPPEKFGSVLHGDFSEHPAAPSRLSKAAASFSAAFSLGVLTALCAGAAVLCAGTLAWDPSDYGTTATITLGTGETLDIFFNCEGGSDAASPSVPSAKYSPPTLMIDADASHGATDFWPLQRELTARGLRSCVFDKPGQGWSSDFRPSQAVDPLTATSLMYEATGERAPFGLVGWGGGGENVYEYALRRPQDVQAIAFLDT